MEHKINKNLTSISIFSIYNVDAIYQNGKIEIF